MELSPLTLFGAELSALATGSGPLDFSRGFDMPPVEAEARRARRMAEQLRGMPSETQKPLLLLLRSKTTSVPWTAVHPSWLGHLIRNWPAQWRLWALDCLPPKLRARVERPGGDRVLVLEGRAPVWWARWFADYVRTRLDYPALPPWERSSADIESPGDFWEMDRRELRLVLLMHGLVGLLMAVRKMARPNAVQVMWQLPANLQPFAADIVQSRKWSDDPFWSQIFEELQSSHEDLQERLTWMALADILRVGSQSSQMPHVKRLAFKIHRMFGSWMLDQYRQKPAWLALPVLPDLESWRAQMRETIERVRSGALPAEWVKK